MAFSWPQQFSIVKFLFTAARIFSRTGTDHPTPWTAEKKQLKRVSYTDKIPPKISQHSVWLRFVWNCLDAKTMTHSPSIVWGRTQSLLSVCQSVTETVIETDSQSVSHMQIIPPFTSGLRSKTTGLPWGFHGNSVHGARRKNCCWQTTDRILGLQRPLHERAQSTWPAVYTRTACHSDLRLL